ncbi:TetR/AcrR family transcriptional regulator [Nonomuraea sp. NPDC047897]|uniref:TetR/AcrR family transcriptional regulator n=1 Tax=Nonomuraea sp. NPDC047897 TaxID=3364346 RepID=UPI00371EC5D6
MAPQSNRSDAPDVSYVKRSDAPEPAVPRADARRNRARILDAAREALVAEGTDASLRAIARRAGVGVGTLYRHFPTREDLIKELVRESFHALTTRAGGLGADVPSLDALATWLDDFARATTMYQGLPASLMATIADESSPLNVACHDMRQAGAALLRRAQDDGVIRGDIDDTDLFALVSAIGWAAEQTATPDARRARLLKVVIAGLAMRDAGLAMGERTSRST